MVKLTLEPPRPLSPQRRQQMVRVGRGAFLLLGTALLVGGLLGGDTLRDGGLALATVGGAALVLAALRASDDTIDKMLRWLPY
jgi:hypothetical protein